MSTFSVMRARVKQVIHRTRAYKRLFIAPGTHDLSEDGQIVLAHLKRFSRYGKPPVAPGAQGDLFQLGRMVGRQETVQMIVEALHLDERTLTNLQEDYRDE